MELTWYLRAVAILGYEKQTVIRSCLQDAPIWSNRSWGPLPLQEHQPTIFLIITHLFQHDRALSHLPSPSAHAIFPWKLFLIIITELSTSGTITPWKANVSSSFMPRVAAKTHSATSVPTSSWDKHWQCHIWPKRAGKVSEAVKTDPWSQGLGHSAAFTCVQRSCAVWGGRCLDFCSLLFSSCWNRQTSCLIDINRMEEGGQFLK